MLPVRQPLFSFALVSARSRSLFNPVKPVVEIEDETDRIELEEELPGGDFSFLLNLGFCRYPVGYFLVAGAGSNEGFEFFGVDLGESEEHLVKRAVEMIGTGSVS